MRDAAGASHFASLPADAQLPDLTTLCAAPLGDGGWAVSTQRGVALLGPDLAWRGNLSVLDGLHQQEFQQLQCGVLDGAATFAGVDGASRLVAPDALRRAAPHLRLTGVNADGRWLNSPTNGSPLTVTAPGLLRFSAVLTPSPLPRQARFRYRLLPGEGSWIDTPTPSLTLAQLGAGRYRVEMMAIDDAGIATDVASLALRIRPPWWRSPLAFAVYVGVALLMVWGIVGSQLRANRALLRLAEETGRQQKAYAGRLEREVEERTRALELEQRKAIRANLDKTRFIASASHDLKQPAGVIRLHVAQARRDDTPLAPAQMRAIDASATTLEKLVDAIVELSRLDANIVVPALAALPVAALFERLQLEFGVAADERQLLFTASADPDLRVRSDELLLRSILANLIDNAIKVSAPGGRLALSAKTRGDDVAIEVRDDGPGLPQELAQRLFEPFQRGTARYAGSGLGLSIVQRTAELLGITIGHRPLDAPPDSGAPQPGTVFELIVPRAEEAESAAADEPLPAAGRIALIDDDAQQRAQLSGMLAERGWQVSVFATLDAFIATGHVFDAILSDVDLGGGADGIAALADYRRQLAPQGQVILMSADRSLRQRLPDEENVPVLLKPVKPARLFWLLQRGVST